VVLLKQYKKKENKKLKYRAKLIKRLKCKTRKMRNEDKLELLGDQVINFF
jgi:hypothetical protein